MDLQLTQQHILITGGSKGIGLACAQGFLREGDKREERSFTAATAEGKAAVCHEMPVFHLTVACAAVD